MLTPHMKRKSVRNGSGEELSGGEVRGRINEGVGGVGGVWIWCLYLVDVGKVPTFCGDVANVCFVSFWANRFLILFGHN